MTRNKWQTFVYTRDGRGLCYNISVDRIIMIIYYDNITHWGRVTHMCISKLSIIGSDNGLSPDRRQAIIWTNAGILLIGTLGINFNDFFFEIHTISFKNIHLKMSSGTWHPFCLGINVFMHEFGISIIWLSGSSFSTFTTDLSYLLLIRPNLSAIITNVNIDLD